jgi:serine/threonine protein kinase
MTKHFSVDPTETLPSFDIREELVQREIYQKLLTRTKSGEPLEFPKILQTFPQLRQHRSYVLDLVYEDYCQRSAAGQSQSPDEYVKTFPEYHTQIAQLLEVHRYFHSTGILPNWLTEPKVWPLPAQVFLGYRICAELGRGAIGRVYLAQELVLAERYVALKVSPFGHEEAKLLAKLNHPNVVPINSVQEDAATGLTAICMPFKGRTTLADLLGALQNKKPEQPTRQFWQELVRRGTGIQNQPIEVPESVLSASYFDTVLDLAIQIVRALVYVHAQKILHRDLKPSNILITPDRTAMLLDFNLSTDMSEIQNRIGGTLPYMAPEQIQQVLVTPGQGPTLDERVDLYSVGAICYELLSGELPFPADAGGSVSKEEAQEYIQKIRSGPLKKLSDLDQRTSNIVLRCLKADPSKRPASAQELLAELEACRAPLAQWKRSAIRHPRRAIGAAILALAIMCSIVAFFVLRLPNEVREYNAGREALEKHLYKEALYHFHNATSERDDYVDAWNGFGRAQYKYGETKDALYSLDHSYKLNSDPRVAACIGYVYCLRGDLQKGIPWLEIAHNQGPNCDENLNNLATAKRLLGSTWQAEALELYNLALKQKPGMHQAAYGRAIVCYTQDRANKKPLRPSILEDIDFAASSPDASAFVLANAAKLHLAFNDRVTNNHREAAKTYALRALEKGLGYHELEGILIQDPVLKDSAFDQYRQQKNEPKPNDSDSYWSDPGQTLFGY